MKLPKPKVKGYKPVGKYDLLTPRQRKTVKRKFRTEERARRKSSTKNKRIFRRVWRKLI